MAQESKKIGDLTNQLEKDVSKKHQKHLSKSKCNDSSTTGSTYPTSVQSSSHGTEPSLTGLTTHSSGGTSNQRLPLTKGNRFLTTCGNDVDLASLMHTVSEWRADQPPILSINECQTAIEYMDNEGLRPCDPRIALPLLDDTLELFKVPDNWDVIAKFYLEAIEDIPEDLLRMTLKHIRLTKKWFPKPVELREYALEKLFERKLARGRFAVMQSKLRGKKQCS